VTAAGATVQENGVSHCSEHRTRLTRKRTQCHQESRGDYAGLAACDHPCVDVGVIVSGLISDGIRLPVCERAMKFAEEGKSLDHAPLTCAGPRDLSRPARRLRLPDSVPAGTDDAEQQAERAVEGVGESDSIRDDLPCPRPAHVGEGSKPLHRLTYV
jgi:hypothetical protein